MVVEVFPPGEFIESHTEMVRFRSGTVTYRMLFEMVADQKLDDQTIIAFAENFLGKIDAASGSGT